MGADRPEVLLNTCTLFGYREPEHGDQGSLSVVALTAEEKISFKLPAHQRESVGVCREAGVPR